MYLCIIINFQCENKKKAYNIDTIEILYNDRYELSTTNTSQEDILNQSKYKYTITKPKIISEIMLKIDDCPVMNKHITMQEDYRIAIKLIKNQQLNEIIFVNMFGEVIRGNKKYFAGDKIYDLVSKLNDNPVDQSHPN